MSEIQALVGVDGRRISNRELVHSMRLSVLAGCLGMLWMSLSVGLPLTMFMQAIGASGVMIGLLGTVRLMSMAAQIPGAMLCEHLGSRKRVWATLAVTHRALWVVPALFALFWAPDQHWVPLAVLTVIALSEVLGNASGAPWISWMTDLVPSKKSGSFWGTRQSIIMAVSVLGLWLAGYILDHYQTAGESRIDLHGFAVVFGLAAFLGVSDIIVHLGVREPRPSPADQAASQFERMLSPLRNRDFRQLTLAIGIWNMGFAMVATFGVVYLKKDFGLSYSELAALTVAGAVGAVVTGYFMGKLIDRLGARISAALLFLTAPLTMLGYFFLNTSRIHWGAFEISQATLVIFSISIVGGALFSGIGLCQLRLIGMLSIPSGRTMWMAVHSCLVGLLAAMGPVIGGVIMDRFAAHPWYFILPGGSPFSFYQAQILLFFFVTWAVALPLLLSTRTPVAEMPFNSAVSEMLLTNPLQVLRNFYNISVMSTGNTSQKRVKAAKKLGGTRSRIAVPDLIGKLDDPSMDLQEESIEALGIIGTPEAVDTLIAKLEDPSSLLAPQICRALRRAADIRAGDALMRQLSAPDRDTVIESVRALGAIGDRRAIPDLLDLIRNTRDNKLVAVSGEALAALGELSAVYQIIPQIRELENRTVKQALSLAVGDLLGEKERFYKLLLLEKETYGTGAAKALNRLSRFVKKYFPKATRQIESIEVLENAYLDREVPKCAETLLHLGLHLIQFIHRMPLTLNPSQAMHNLIEQDRQAALGIWYLKILNEEWIASGGDTRNSTDILLGIHLVGSITAAQAENLKSPEAAGVDRPGKR
ncbi:MAG: MFS transporter [Terrimicrobiaceae bacterium]